MSAFNLQITDSALQQIKTFGSPCFRIAVTGGGCSGFKYEFEITNVKNPNDLVIAKNGIEILIDSTFQDMLNDCTLDFETTMFGARFKITNPNASKACGCGNSFAV